MLSFRTRPMSLSAVTMIPLAFLATPLAATTWYVPSQCPTIQAGIDSAAAGDTVQVACGIYTWSGQGTGTPNGLIILKSGIHLIGEAATPECVTIDAEGLGRIAYCSSVTGIHIEGLTFTGGGAGVGSAMLCGHSGLTITDCDFVENVAGCGGALNCGETLIAFNRCVFMGNGAYDAGAIFCEDNSNLEFVDCWFEGNVADDRGGVMYSENSSDPTFDHCVFVDNVAAEGGALYFSYDHPTITNCTFARNRAMVGGSAVAFEGLPTQIMLEQCVVWGSPEGVPFSCFVSTVPTLKCCNVYGNTDGDWVSCIAVQASFAGNFSADPLFCDVDNNDFTLHADSPCLPGNHPSVNDCDLIGAYGEGCPATALDVKSWARIKAGYR